MTFYYPFEGTFELLNWVPELPTNHSGTKSRTPNNALQEFKTDPLFLSRETWRPRGGACCTLAAFV